MDQKQPTAEGVDWPYRADRPQRYSINYSRYRSLGGHVDLDRFVRGFVHGGANRNDMARFYFFCLAFDQLVKEGIEGDLVELGAYKGHTAALLADIARTLGRTAYILDTFEGFDANDLVGIDSVAKTSSFADTSLESVRARVGEENVQYIKGYFPQTAVELPADGRYSLAHIDCDLYAPIMSALEYFYPRMTPGGYLIVHDYSSLYWNGAEKAVDEFFADKLEAVVPLPDSAGSVVVRKAREPQSGDNWLRRKRASLLREDWVSAANGGLRDVLGTGWSGPENWGVWGVGPVHELHLVLPRSADVLELQCDVHALLAGNRTTQQVDVMMGETTLAKWEFTQSTNRSVRSVRLQRQQAGDTREEVTLHLRPRVTESPQQLKPGASDGRPLGMALHRMRFRHLSV